MRMSAISAIEQAMWDIVVKSSRKPVCSLLGRKTLEIQCLKK
jgi:L-alanine-DL-glutamate epimerase-like enolase superfamily enzyme